MKKNYFLSVLFSLVSLAAFAQPANDNCNTATNLGSLPNPGACSGGLQNGAVVSSNGTLVGATAANPYVYNGSGCTGTSSSMASPANDVWYRFTATGTTVNITMTGTVANPNIAVYSGSCGSLGGGVGGCTVGANNGTASLTITQVSIGTTYYIQVSGNSATATGTFTLNVDNDIDCNDCLREATLTASPLPVNGTYQPGQSVQFCYSVTEWSQQNTNWIHGVQLTYGSGWTNSVTGTNSPAPVCNTGTWNYYPTGIGNANGTNWGPGWYFDTNDGGTAPNNNFGDGGLACNPDDNDPLTFCWTLTVPTSCTPGASLSVTLNTSGDGESGGWSSAGCLDDAPSIFNATVACCPPTTAFTPVSCPGGSNGSITVTPVGTNGPYSYSWSGPGGYSSTSSNVAGAQTQNNLIAGSYTITVTDADACSQTVTVVVTTANTLPIANAGADITICSQATGNLGAATTAGYSYLWTPATGLSSSTISNPTVTLTNSGATSTTSTYTLTVTGPGGCTAVDQVVVTVRPKPIANFPAVPNQCLTGNSFSFTNNTSPVPVGTTYNWTFASGSPASSTATNPSGITWSAAGTYAVTLTATASTCVTTYTQNVTIYPMPVVGTSTTPVLCNGGTTGTASATGGGTYSWNTTPVQTGSTATGLAAGNYTVTVTSADGCPATATVTITQPTALTATQSQVNNLCNGASTGTATVTPSGGTGAYTYSWSTGATTATATGLAAGSYTVTIRDANGCQITRNFTITQPTAITTTTSSTAATCGASNGSATVTPAGGTGAYTYSWATTPAQTTATATNLPAGSYTVTVRDANNCVVTATVSVSNTSAPTATASGTNVLCFGASTGTATVSVSGAAGPYTYSWSNGATTQSLTNIPAGTYNVSVTAANGCGATSSVVITQPAAALAATTAQQNVTCNGSTNGTATVTPSGGTGTYTYSWNTSPSQNTATATGLGAGSYTVTITDANGCVITRNFTITQPSAMSLSTSSVNASCGANNGSATVTATGGTGALTYSWSTTPSQTTATATNLAAGAYTIRVTDANGCFQTTTVSVNNNASPTATITGQVNVSCFGGSNGSATVSASGGTGAYTYSWSNGQTTATATGLSAGPYSVTVTDAAGCSASTTVTITQPTALTAGATGVNPTCNGATNGSATVTASGGTTSYTYSWNTTPSQNTATATNLGQGNYTVTVTDAGGCTTTASVTLTQPTAIVVTAAQDSVSCFGLSNGSAMATASGGTGTLNYSWNPSGITSATATGLAAGSYTVTVTDANGCTNTATTTVLQPVALTGTTASTNVSCNGGANGTATVTPGGGTSPYQYSWSNGQTSQTATGLAAGTFNVTVTDANGCTITRSATITQPAAIFLTTSNTDVFCGQSNGTVSVSASGGTGAYTYSWSSAPVQTTATATGLGQGTYNVTVTDANGCSANASATISNNSGGSASSTSTAVSCFGGSNGTATATMTGGTSPYTYSWNTTPSQAGATATGLSAGTYSVTITDNVGCQVTTGVVITQPTVLTANATSTNVTCNQGTNGTATATAAGGTGSYTYSWSSIPSQSTAVATGLTPGNYTVTVRDANNCSATASVVITEPSAIAPVTSTVNQNCTAPNGSATVSATGGTPSASGYSYSWSTTPSQTTPSISGLVAGTYTVSVSDSLGCFTTATAVVGSNPGGNATVTTVFTSCNGGSDGSATVSMSGAATPPYTYSWNNGQTTPTATGLIAGTYTVTVTDSYGCIATASGEVDQPALLVTTITSANATCNGASTGSASVSVTGGTSPFIYSWSNGPTTFNNPNIPAGSYSVIVTDDNGCMKSATVNISEPSPVVVVETDHTDATCNQSNGASTVSASGGTGSTYTYSWSPGGYSSAAVTGIPANTYIVTATDQNGCTGTLPVTILNLTGPSVSVTSTNVSCFGGNNGSATVTATGGELPYSYTWSTVPAQLTPTANNLTAGNYTVQVRDNTGCTASTSVTITQPTQLVINTAGVDPLCFGACNGSATATPTGGVSPYSYSWSNGSTAFNATALCAGTVNLVVTDSNACTMTASVTITNPPQFTVSTSVTNLSCQGSCNGTATVTTSNGSTPYTYSWTGGQTTATATQLCAGTYTISVTDGKSCQAQGQAIITEPATLGVTIPTSGNVSCFGGANGFANASVTGGTGPYTFSWSPGNYTTSSPTGLSAGLYTVTVTDANGCTATATKTITQPAALIATTTKVNATCYGVCNGSATVTLQGGTGPYTYLWTPGGQTTATATQLCAGNYNINVTDANGCVVVNSVTITQPSLLAVNTTVVNSNCQQNNGRACATIAGGIPPYTYQWNDPATQTTSCATNLFANSYMITVTDGNGCTAQAPANVNDISGPTVTMASSTNITCYGDSNGTALANISGGVAPYNIAWTPTGPTSTFANNLAQGWHSITVTDSAGCVGSASVFITQPAEITGWVTSVNPSCFGSCNGSATINASGGTGPLTYFWNSNPSQTTQTATGLCAGNYTVTVTDSNNCSAQFNRVLTQPQPLVLGSAVITNVSCFGDNDGGITINPSGGTPAYNVQWAPNAGTGNQISGLVAGSYTATVTDSKGCTETDTYVVTEPPLLVVSVTGTNSTCGNSNATLSSVVNGGTAAYSYQWVPGGQTTSSVTNVAAGFYTLNVTDSKGCTANDTITLINIPGPTISSITFQSPSCFGTLTGTATVNPAGGTLPYTYSWSANGQTTQTATALGAGSYNIQVTDANGCVATGITTVTQPALLTLTSSADITICYGQNPGTSLYSTAQGGTAAYTYSWSNGYNLSGPNVVSPLTNTAYYINVTDSKGCVARDTINVTVREPLAVTSPDVTICSGEQATVSATATGGLGTYTYTWTPGGAAQASFTTSPAATTTYTVQINDGCSSPASDTMVVIVNPRPFVVISPVTDQCLPATISFGVTTDIGTTFIWDIPGAGTSTQANPSFLFESPGDYDVTVTVSSAAGCTTTVSQPDWLTIYPKPVAIASANQTTTTIVNPVINFTDLSIGATMWNWNFGDEDTSTVQHPTHTYQDSGIYVVNLTVSNDFGCTDDTTLLIVVEPDWAIYVPNAFTPNGDNINDFFGPFGIGMNPDKFKMFIFDRWGNLIYETTNLNKPWDGKANNGSIPAQEDVYIWKIAAESFKGEKREMMGHVSLVK